MQFFPISTKGIKAKLNELESESDIFPQNEGKVGKSELTPVVKALNNCAMLRSHSDKNKLQTGQEGTAQCSMSSRATNRFKDFY